MRRASAAILILGTLALSGVVAPARAAGNADVNSLGLDASYSVNATFNWHARTADVRTNVTVRGSKPWTSSVLAFNLQTLRIGHAHLQTTTVDGNDVTPTVDDQTVLVPLDPPLAPGGTTKIEIDYTGQMSGSPNPDGYDWGFAATGSYLTGYRWIPWLSRTMQFNNSGNGDPSETASASHVHVAITADPSLIFATTGVQTSSDGDTRVFDADNVRDFNFAASPFYRKATRNVRGIAVTAYFNALSGSTMLDVTARAINDYTSKVGPYPYPALNIAEVGPWASVESPGLFWVADNVPGHLLAWTTAHETAHQWFYSVVGNDQALEPFADEALVDFMARNLLDDFVPSQCAPDYLDRTIYNIGACYPWVVYVQGNLWLRAYRDAAGSSKFWSGVASYYNQYKFGIGGTRQLLDALDAARGKPQVHTQFPRLYALPVPDLPFGVLPSI
jgi:hypothetical protein